MAWKQNWISGEAGIKSSWRTLGIAGAGRAVGTTHLTVWTANWLASACRKTVAVLEWNGQGDFERMREFCAAGKKSENHWKLLEVDYFSGAGGRELAACINGTYDKILVDYGMWSDAADLEWARCDRKILIGSLSEWQAEVFSSLVKKLEIKDKNREYGMVFGSDEARTAMEKAFRITVQRIPFSADAFAVTGSDMEFFRTWNALI